MLAVLVAVCGCAKRDDKEPEPVVPVQVTAVRQDSIRRIITADAVLFPRDQASLTPKISAPVRRFLREPRRSRNVRANFWRSSRTGISRRRQPPARGSSNRRSRPIAPLHGASVPEEVNKAQADVRAAQQTLDAAKNCWTAAKNCSRKVRWRSKLVDEAQVSFAQARSQLRDRAAAPAQLQAVGRQEQIRGAAAQVEAARAQVQAAEAQLGYSEIRSPIRGIVTDRPLYAGEMANAGSPLLTVMDVSRVDCAREHSAEPGRVPQGRQRPATITGISGTEEVTGQGHYSQSGGRSEQHHRAGLGASGEPRRAAAARNDGPRGDRRGDARDVAVVPPPALLPSATAAWA